MSKKENFDHRSLGWLLHGVGIFGVNREATTPIWQQLELINHIGEIFDHQGILGIFPEGTRRSGDKIAKADIKIGTAALALYFGGNIIPAGLGGTENPHLRGGLSVVLEEPIHVEKVPQDDIQSMSIRDFVKLCKPITNELYEKLNEAQSQAALLVA